jgi:hypothetical protein
VEIGQIASENELMRAKLAKIDTSTTSASTTNRNQTLAQRHSELADEHLRVLSYKQANEQRLLDQIRGLQTAQAEL